VNGKQTLAASALAPRSSWQMIKSETSLSTALRPICIALAAAATVANAQIDPDARQILHLGINAPLNGNGPKGAYAFYYWNMPNVPTTNQTLRLAIAPTYLDSELGFRSLLGPNTDFALGARAARSPTIIRKCARELTTKTNRSRATAAVFPQAFII
jgi:hypothetical protein